MKRRSPSKSSKGQTQFQSDLEQPTKSISKLQLQPKYPRRNYEARTAQIQKIEEERSDSTVPLLKYQFQYQFRKKLLNSQKQQADNDVKQTAKSQPIAQNASKKLIQVNSLSQPLSSSDIPQASKQPIILTSGDSENMQEFNTQLLPFTFVHTQLYEQKCSQINNLMKDNDQEAIIQWIERNNCDYNNFKTNCRLLNFVKSEYFWKTAITRMLSDVLQFSNNLPEGHITFFNNYITKPEMEIKRKSAYIILCQMFFGLIPKQFHNVKYQTQCTFGIYMNCDYRLSQSTQYIVLSIEQQSNLNKIMALVWYFISMSNASNHEQSKREKLKLQYIKITQLKKNQLHASELHKSNKLPQPTQYFGSYGEFVFTKNIQVMKNRHSKKFQKVGEDDSIHSSTEIQSIFSVDIFSQKQQNLGKFMFEHPETFVLKLILNQQICKKDIILLNGLRKFANCIQNDQKQFILQGKFPVESESLQKSRQFSRLFLIKKYSKSTAELSNYKFKRIKKQLQFNLSLLRPAFKGYYAKKQLFINFNDFHHTEFYLDFLLLWMSISCVITSKCQVHIFIQGLEREWQFSLNKIIKSLENMQVADGLTIIDKYFVYIKSKPEFKKNARMFTFIKYLKNYLPTPEKQS